VGGVPLSGCGFEGAEDAQGVWVDGDAPLVDRVWLVVMRVVPV
jgi:hypothetical protein